MEENNNYHVHPNPMHPRDVKYDDGIVYSSVPPYNARGWDGVYIRLRPDVPPMYGLDAYERVEQSTSIRCICYANAFYLAHVVQNYPAFVMPTIPEINL